MADLAINLLASVITGVAVWAFSRLGRRRRTQRMRAFFGVEPGTRAWCVVGRHHRSPDSLSVHRLDSAAVVELAAVIMACGGRSELLGSDEAPAALGAVPELSVGGPGSNGRTASHLRLLVPGVRVLARGHGAALVTGDRVHEWSGSDDEPAYAVLVKTYGSPPAAPVFLVCGLTAASNRAAAHHLTANHRELARRYGTGGRFALLLTLRGLHDYGADAIVDVEDITPVAFTAPATPP
jgi:hypothetical protein